MKLSAKQLRRLNNAKDSNEVIPVKAIENLGIKLSDDQKSEVEKKETSHISPANPKMKAKGIHLGDFLKIVGFESVEAGETEKKEISTDFGAKDACAKIMECSTKDDLLNFYSTDDARKTVFAAYEKRLIELENE